MKWSSFLIFAVLTSQLVLAHSQSVYQREPVPDPFTQGTRYPDRDEDVECRPIKLRVRRNSVRFHATITQNSNTQIRFETFDASLMTSRMKSRLDILALWYYTNYGTQLRVSMSYIDGNDPGSGDSSIRSTSLHYEGRSARISGSHPSHLPAIAHQAALSGFDWVYYADQDYCRVSVIPDICQTDIDLMFLVDESGSVGSTNYELAVQFMQSVVNFYDVEENRTRVAMISFSTNATINFIFNDHLSNQAINEAIGRTRYNGGFTHTAWALYFARLIFYGPNLHLSGARPLSAGVPRVVVLITDGHSNHYRVDDQALFLREDNGATIYSVGIANYDLDELNLIASDPDSEHVFLLQSYSDAASFVQLLSGTTCDTPATLPPGKETETECEEDDFRYFQIECPVFSVTIIVEQIDVVGHCAIYVSTTGVNPGPLDPPAETIRDETLNVNRRRLTVNITAATTSIHISIRGITPIRNRFRLVVWNMLFTEDIYSVTVSNGVIDSDSIINLDVITGNDAYYIFNITEGNEAGKFSIDNNTGQIYLTEALNAEQQDFYNLTVVAYLGSNDCQRGKAYVEVYVSAANQNPPVFQTTGPVSVIETFPSGTFIVHVTATDADFGINGVVRYSITEGNMGDAFAIDSVTGAISVAAPLNHTILSSYTLTLTAMDQATINAMTGTTTQVINILDVNQSPFFLTLCAREGACSLTVPEDRSLNVVLNTISAGDPDLFSNGQLDYRIKPAGTPFSIDNMGRIILVESLDREMQDTYLLKLNVSDRGSSPLSIAAVIAYTVTDVNDNAPVLTIPLQVSVSEGAFVGDGVLQASASDADIGVNAQVEYLLDTGSPLFAIDSSTGAVTLAQSLDYEQSTEHSIVLRARNPDGLPSSPRTSTVLVMNENDNSPIFTMDRYTASVTEGSSTGTPVITVQANDADDGALGVVSYSITGGNSNNDFTINSTSGVITVNGDLDREVISEYTLTIRAQDGGNPARSDGSMVVITVNDINDNSPIFQRSLYTITVREDITVPSDLLTLVATDADEAGSQNSAITYSIQTGNTRSVFRLAANNGTFSVIESLDFESVSSYSLDVVATDGGSRTGSAVVMVTVTDVNDEAPNLSPDQAIAVSEDTSTPSVITNFNASGEMGEVLQFQLSGDQNGEFVINSNGKVSLVQSLDYESRQEFRLTVTVTDSQFPTSSLLTITVTDVNDNTPIISPAGPYTINEERPSNSLVGSVSASDRDSGNNAELSFQITQQPLNLFTFVPDGGNAIQIRTATVLDREDLAEMNYLLPPNSQSDITIEVSDNGNPRLTSNVTVTIRLQDINDNAPTLVNPVSEVNISESSSIGTMVTRVVARDADIGVNAVVSLSLRGDSSFTIDSSTGVITLANSLDFESRREHTIMVTASNPDNRQSPEHVIVVRVIDENDNSPIFTMNPYTASVSESSSIGTQVLVVEANDDDSGVLGEVRYSIVGGNIGTAFGINETTGLITVNADIDRELINTYTLTVTASNPGPLSQIITSRVEITVTDINDNPPLFMPSRYTLNIREDATLNDILTVVITDGDEPGNANSQFNINITSGNENGLFAISSPNGVLSLASSLDYEVQTNHELTLTATDRGAPSMSSTAIVQIAVVNVNDDPPMISGNQTVHLSESLAVGSTVTQFTATAEQGETLEFSIISNGLLAIDSANGRITLAGTLDYETEQSFTAQVTVSDGLFSSSAYLTVSVVDENDNAPQIAPAGPFRVREEMMTGTLVGNVTASDADSVGGPLMFSFLGTNVLNFFSISSQTGDIHIARVLDREALIDDFPPPGSSQTFTVSVSDANSSSTVDITFQLLDINDNEPIITNLLFQYDINENSAIGTEVFIVTAMDADLGSNAVISYSISTSPFTINENTGIVTVNASLDYEDMTECLVTITASDGTLSSNQSVTIHINDINDNAPVFSMSSYTAQVTEHSSINTSVTNISATDNDSGAFGMISYALEGDNDMFRIVSTTGEVVINQDIDREAVTQLTFTVVASDGGNPAMSASASVVVSIIDINDNSPVFQQPSYVVRVREDTAVSTNIITILGTDADEEGNPNSQIGYTFETSSTVFSISQIGVISLISSLDFEATSSYTLTAVATDRGTPMLSGRTNLEITVINVNDQPPEFNRSQSIMLSELTPVLDRIARFTATSDTNEAVTYELTGTQNGEFEINMTTGIVTLVRSLDYEGTQFYSLRVTANDTLFSTSSAFNITVTDENDNFPQFETVGILEVIEEQAVGTPVGQVTASDADSGVNAMISYSFVQLSTLNHFNINPNTGEIVTANTLDRELLVQENLFLPPSSQITFQVQATDLGSPPLFSQIDVTIQLNDINDNRPTFVNSERQAMIEENTALGESVTTVTATDLDFGINALVSYALSGSSFFVVDNTTGVISVSGQLDYETARQHSISITASNPDGVASIPSHDIIIFVTDVNDNTPIFTMNPYTASIEEHSSTGTPVITVQADDDDSGLLGQVRYSIGNNDANVFTINETSGAISISGGTDRETVDSYIFTVEATDGGGTTARSAVTTIVVTITDINDNIPVFNQSVYHYSIREDTSIPMVLLTVSAADADQSGTLNSRVSYSINDGAGLLEIDNASGSFSVTSSLDFETQSSYSIQVMATDSGLPSLTGIAQILINVINVNDQPPQLSGNQMIELSELTTTMSRVTQFTTTGEEGETLQFSLAGDGADTIFDMNPTTGIVTLLSTLDFETTPFYSYMVTVSDGMFTSSPSTLNITILDENDNAPQFISNNLITFEEERPVNTVIGQINATDIDSGVNGQLSYLLVELRANVFFTINSSSGEITSAVVIDREGLAEMNALIMLSQITFDVQVTDNGNPAHFSTQTVTFEIIDINDNVPEFINPPTVISVLETASVQSVVTELSAVDRDLGRNAIISYSLTGPAQFTINGTTGTVTLAGSLDYETSTEHTIMVTASNPDGLTSIVHNITIQVIDDNDNSPIFTMNPYTASVEEHSSTGTPVITVQADDDDSGILGQVSYSITSGNNEATFIINSTTGLISVNGNIDREMLDAYILGVMATDGGRRSAQSTVEISVMDINDNSPVFDPSSYSITVYENVSINSTIISVTATDADADGPNSDISYSIPSGNGGNLFRISSTGEISIVSSLDYETATSHSLIVQATDNGMTTRSSSAVVSVTVMDINDIPVDLGDDQVVNVSEYTTVNSRIAQFSVLNVEQSDNISFTLSGDGVDNFRMDPSTGVITLVRSLDYEATQSYALAVTVSDGVFDNSAQLTVNVLDENDNQPMIETANALMIEEEMDENATVGQVRATDGDSGLNGQIEFSIISNIGGGLFAINTSTGMIYTTAVLDREVLANMNLFAPPESQQMLVVQAEDQGMPSLFSQASVIIQLLDINDNSPQFVNELSYISLPENIPNNTFILDASATDADLGVNREISYSLTTDTSSLPFFINSLTGAVTTSSTLDREQIDFYTITVSATDNGSLRRLMSSFIVNVTVTDINDNAPVFLGEPYGESIPENAATDGGGSIDLLRVYATDADIGTNGLFTYSLAPDTNRRFSIRNQTGELRVSGGINFEEESEFNVTIIARDMGTPSLSSTTIVQITIINVDEFAPVFLGSCDASISEARNISRDSNPVTQCIAVDQDSGSVDYSIQIESGNPALTTFLLDQLTGEVFLTQSLDRETIDTYQFTLEASSGGFLTTRMLVTITIEDVNDNAPVFSPSQLAVTYSNPQAQNIVTLTVTDDDINENAELSVSIVSVVRTNQPNDRDTHEIIITAEDMGVPSMSANATVVVTNGFPCQIMEFGLDPDTVQLSVATLCSLSNPPVSQNYILGTEVILNCSAVSNLAVTYQWQLNGSFITNPSSNPQLNLSRIDFDDSGAYSCISRTDIGSIQSVTAFIGIHTFPEIVRPPESNAVETQRALSLTCVSSGVPSPTVTFFHKSSEVQLDSRVIQQGHFLIITSAEEGDNGEYYCTAENVAGAVQSEPARLVIFSQTQIVTTTILVDNPSDDGTCHNLDVGMIEGILLATTAYGAEVTTVKADGFCNSGPCYPNPCMNDGRCSLNENATGGYECTCSEAFEGNNCELDIDECTEEDPCFSGGTCTNTIGGFSCACLPDRTGHRCQYQIRCTDDSLCTNDTTCIETLVNIDGYVCDSTPDDMTLTITGVNVDQLHEAEYDLANLLVMSANSNRKRRQVTAVSSDICEPRFIPLNNDDSATFKLIWACPDDGINNNTSTDTIPSPEIQELICETLLDKKIVTDCIYSNGESAVTAVQGLQAIEVLVSFIMLDPETNIPISGSEAVKILGDKQTLEAFETAGFQASEFTAPVPSTEDPGTDIVAPTQEGPGNEGLGGGAIAGIVIGILIIAGLVTLVAVIGLCYIQAHNKRAKYGINESKTASTLMRNIESGRERTQTVVGVFENPTFRQSMMLETTIPDENGKDAVFSNPRYQDITKITKLDGNTKPINKNAINRL